MWNKFKPNSNEEMSADQEKATLALNELLSFAMSKARSSLEKDDIWKEADIIRDFIFKEGE
tara:strand:+ start:8403 stop:8585 length:183 start_codon:yes stop_codon:yes gene_type:complete